MNNTLLNKRSSTIGIFDSGLGGLTILNTLKRKFPKNKFIYFGDTAHLPYGTKSNESIINYSNKIVKFLLSKGADIIIVACHSASSVALDTLEAMYEIPIIGVIDSSIERAINTTENRKIGVLGTHTTIKSHAYRDKIKAIDKKIMTYEVICPLFVPIVEEGLEDSDIALSIVKLYLNKLKNIKLDTVILACTHYPILIKTITKVISSNINIINTGESVYDCIKDKICTHKSSYNLDEYYVSDVPYRFDKLASKFLKHRINKINHVKL